MASRLELSTRYPSAPSRQSGTNELYPRPRQSDVLPGPIGPRPLCRRPRIGAVPGCLTRWRQYRSRLLSSPKFLPQSAANLRLILAGHSLRRLGPMSSKEPFGRLPAAGPRTKSHGGIATSIPPSTSLAWLHQFSWSSTAPWDSCDGRRRPPDRPLRHHSAGSEPHLRRSLCAFPVEIGLARGRATNSRRPVGLGRFGPRSLQSSPSR
jgi:hypothetical protein